MFLESDLSLEIIQIHEQSCNGVTKYWQKVQTVCIHFVYQDFDFFLCWILSHESHNIGKFITWYSAVAIFVENLKGRLETWF